MLVDNLIQEKKEYELLLCAAAALDQAYVVRECAWLAPEKFSNPEYALFWTGVLSGRSAVAVAGEINKRLYVDLISASNQVMSATLAKEYAHEIDRKAYLMNIARQVGELGGALAAERVEVVQNVIEQMSKTDTGAAVMARTSTEGLETWGGKLDNLEGVSIPTNIIPLDKATGGFERQTMSILAARPSMGKTALAWQICRNVAQAGGKALFMSLEMSEHALWSRAVCGRIGVRWRDVRAGRVGRQTIAELHREKLALMEELKGRVYVIDKGSTTRTLWHEISKIRPDVVIVDHLRHLRDKHPSELVRLGHMSARLKEMSIEFDNHMICLHQLNRGVENRDNKRPRLSDLRESGHLEENADIVMFLYREGYYTDDTSPIQETELNLAKNRDDVPNLRINLMFDMSRQWFAGRIKGGDVRPVADMFGGG